MKRFLLYCMTGAILAVAGCNGGGGGMTTTPPSPTPPPTTPTPPTPTTNPVSLSDLLMGYMTVPAGEFTVNAGQSMDRGHARFSCPAGGANCMITVAADGMVTSVGAQATAMPSDKAREDRGIGLALRENKIQVSRPSWPAIRGVDVSTFKTTIVPTPATWDADYTPVPGIAADRATIGPIWATPPNAGYPFTSPPTPTSYQGQTTTPTTTPAPEPNPLGDTLNVQPEKHLTDAGTPEFMNQNMDLPGLGTFKGEVHKRTMTANNVTTTDELLIYHDRKQSGPVPYNQYYAADGSNLGSTVDNRLNGGARPTSGQNLIGSGTFHANNTRLGVTRVTYGTTGSPQKGVLTLDNGSALSAAATALFAAPNDNFPSVNNQTFTYSADANTKPRTFPGTFHGVAGQYICGDTSCTIAKGSDGNFDLNGAWTFTPTANPNEILLPGLDHDTDYLVFGVWVRKTDRSGQDPIYSIGSIGQGSKPFGRETNDGNPNTGVGRQNDAIKALRGNATYTGRAAGRYARATLKADGSRSSDFGGLFTAKVRLTAQFGTAGTSQDGEVSINDQFSIKGTVTDFRDPQNTYQDLSDWSVELQRSQFGLVPATSSNPPANTFQYSNTFPEGGGSAIGMTGNTPSPRQNGHWVGRFNGPVYNAATAKPGQTAANTHPTGVAGGFFVNFTNGRAVGGYGATLKSQ